jgi:hypothetical protein
MTTLAANKQRNFAAEGQVFEDLPAVAADILYEGSAGGDSSGNVRPLVAADAFCGFVVRQCDNSAGAAGDKKVRLMVEGYVQADITGVASVDDLGATVYMSDDDVFTLTSSSNSSVGKIARYISGTTCLVFFQSASRRSI